MNSSCSLRFSHSAIWGDKQEKLQQIEQLNMYRAYLYQVGLNLLGKVVDGDEVDLVLAAAAARPRSVGRHVARRAAP